MDKHNLWTVAIVLFSVSLRVQAGGERFVQKIALPGAMTAVVAEGDFEARSLGSFAVRLYSSRHARPGDDTTFFVDGIICKRNGTVEQVEQSDLDGDGKPELMVTVRSVGTGNYLSAYAFGFDRKRIWLQAHVEGLPPGSDPVAALKTARKKK